MTPLDVILYMSAFGLGLLVIAFLLTIAIVFALAFVGWVQGERPRSPRS